MRYIFLCFIFFTTICFGQHKSKQPSKIPGTPKTIAATDTTATTPKQAKPDTALAVTYQSTESQLSKKIYITDTTFFAVHIVIGNGYETVLQGIEKSFTTDKDLIILLPQIDQSSVSRKYLSSLLREPSMKRSNPYLIF
jgi:hypothetical protein